MKVGIIGIGNVGSALGKLWVECGHDICFSFNRDPEQLEVAAKQAGPRARAGTPAEAAEFGEVVVLSVPWGTVREALKQAVAQARARGVEAVTLVRETKKASPVDVILEAEQNADLTVMATHGRRGLDRLTLGSVTEGLLRRSDKPRLIVRCTVDPAANRGE